MYDVLILGCGITGASAAFMLSKYRLKVGILERENDVAQGATKANSAILHAGYDPEPGTLMAKLNVRGSLLARELCEKLDVPYRQCGSMVLAFSEQEEQTLRTLLGPCPGTRTFRRSYRGAPCPHCRHLLSLGAVPCPCRDSGKERCRAFPGNRGHRNPAGSRGLEGFYQPGCVPEPVRGQCRRSLCRGYSRYGVLP